MDPAPSGTLIHSVQTMAKAKMGVHGTAANATAAFQAVGGIFTSQPTAVDAGDYVKSWHDARGFAFPHVEALALASFTTSATAATATEVTGFGAFRDLDVQVRVTGLTGTTPTANVLIDSKIDGTNWVNILQTVDVITGTTKLVAHLTRRQAQGVVDVTIDAGEGTTRAIGFGDSIRVRHAVAGTTPALSYTVYANGIS